MAPRKSSKMVFRFLRDVNYAACHVQHVALWRRPIGVQGARQCGTAAESVRRSTGRAAIDRRCECPSIVSARALPSILSARALGAPPSVTDPLTTAVCAAPRRARDRARRAGGGLDTTAGAARLPRQGPRERCRALSCRGDCRRAHAQTDCEELWWGPARRLLGVEREASARWRARGSGRGAHAGRVLCNRAQRGDVGRRMQPLYDAPPSWRRAM